MIYFYLNDDHSVRECTLEEWANQFEELSMADKKHVGMDEINDCDVSTVWLGMNHNYFGGRPLLFETMVFRGNSGLEEYCERYSTWDEAVEGHRKAIDWVINGCKKYE